MLDALLGYALLAFYISFVVRSSSPSSVLVLASVLLHLLASPYTKVEESFNIQATHDILKYDVPFRDAKDFFAEHYDHVSYPGSVPRTFVGPLVLATVSKPLLSFAQSAVQQQLIVRAVLGLYNAGALIVFQNAIAQTFGRAAGTWFALFQASQFHIIYYASRTLPNMFAFGLTVLAMGNLVLAMRFGYSHAQSIHHVKLATYLLSFTGVVFRSEVGVFLVLQVSFLLWQQPLLLRPIIFAGLVGSIIGLLTTVPLDSFFWQQFPLWPEWTAFYYNTILGKSSEWGISPWSYYVSNAIPKLILNPLCWAFCVPLTLTSPALRPRTFAIITPSFMFVSLLSFLPHKEWRFIIYIIPPLTAVASAGAAWIWNRRRRTIIYKLFSILIVLSIPASFLISTTLLGLSSLNYPGGEALTRLHDLQWHAQGQSGRLRVHLDDLTCQTGATRFLQRSAPPLLSSSAKGTTEPPWVYDKTDNATSLLDPTFWLRFDYALTEAPERVIGSWDVLGVVHAFDGVRVLRPGDGNVGVYDVDFYDEEFDERFRAREGGREVPLTLRGKTPYMAEWYFQYVQLGILFRRYVTRGWWLHISVEPRIWVLKQNVPASSVTGVIQ